MATVNLNYAKLAAGYLFPEIARRTKAFQEDHSGVEVMKLGIGNTTEPLTFIVAQGLFKGAHMLVDKEHYTGYGSEQGQEYLRKRIKGNYC